ncbi:MULTISPECIES: hypothetical protein [Streptomyces]|uniref:Uncharacterized protein n=1 Tax=Streptomyces clavifer TaxID=68188 RepID=A0ABS4VI38_9ACTN|nr:MULTISPECIES: hypothetical protein [Streptomyces]MBP2363591.1 hypothetical protein [Streptomyces clavifer]MDX2748426.1 hypothetical protein [Streptomyces sp. NRRL_B-2557]GHB18865.1 hypothetical protein GCM10010392_54400 [Streptomyces clavifer]
MQTSQAQILSPADLLAAYEMPLLSYVHDRLELIDYRRGRELARAAWTVALGTLQLVPDTGMEGDLPAWLARAARQVVREQTSPSFHAQLLTVAVREQASGWPPRHIAAAA